MRRRQGEGDEREDERRACHLHAFFFSAVSLYDITGGGGEEEGEEMMQGAGGGRDVKPPPLKIFSTLRKDGRIR